MAQAFIGTSGWAYPSWRQHLYGAAPMRRWLEIASNTFGALHAAGVAVCISDAPDFPLWREVTTDFVYVRLHGHTRKYASSYSLPHLKRWAAAIEDWLGEGREVHVYFDNDAEGHAVRNALTLKALVSGAPLPAHRRIQHQPTGPYRGASWSGPRSAH